MSELSTGQLGIDIQPYLDQLDKATAGANLLAEAGRSAGEATTKSFAAAAAAQVDYTNRVAAGTAEVRNAQAATRSAMEEVRRLADANREAAAAQKGLSNTSAEYQRLKGLIAANNEEIKKAKAAINENRQATEQERAAVQAVRDARREEVNQTKLVTAAARDAAAAAKQEAAAQKEAGAATQASGNSGGFLSGVLGKVGAAFAGIFAINKLKQLGEDIVDTTAEFQRMEAVLTTINNGDDGKAQRQFAELRAFTLRNPFEVKEVTEGYVTLRNVGINPTINQLQSLADLAAASGKSFDTVTSSLLGATTGRFVQLKQFGITAKQQGDTVAFTFRGVTTVVEKTQKAISDYVFSLGQLNSVQGATERIMNTTGGRLTNLKDSLTELFNVIGEGTDGPLNRFVLKLTLVATKLREALKSNEQKALDQLADTGALQDYSKVVDRLFARATEQAKKGGTDVAFAIGAAAAQQANLLDKQLAKAEAAVKALPQDYSEEYLKAYGGSTLDRAANEAAAADRQRRLKQVELIKGEISVLKERRDVALKGSEDETNQLGLLAAARAKLAADEKTREENTDKSKSHALNLLIIADQKVIDDLLEKQNKTRQKQALSYESQLRALLQERATLTSLAAKAAADSADDAAGKARAVFDEALRQVDVVQAKLVQRELDLRKQALKAGGSRAVAGLGEKADGTVDGVQAAQLTALRVAAMDAYYTALYKITAEREQRLFDLRQDSDAKEVEAVDRKFDKLIKASTDGIERQAIEEQRQREQTALRAAQEQKRIDQTRALATNSAQAVGQVYGTGTGVSVFEAKRAEAQALLNIEKKAAEDSLNNTLNKVGREADIERQALREQLARIANQQKALDAEQQKSEFSIYKLVLGENDSPELRAALDEVASSVVSSLREIVQAEQQAAAQKASTATQNINELQSSLNAEIQLNKEGSASNIKGLQAQINEQRAIRKEALEDQRKAAQEQVIIDTITQASSIATAAANVFAAFSAIPYVGVPLGIGAAGLLVAAFVASKAKAYQAASQIGAGTPGFFTGGYTGGADTREERGVVHGKEFVHTAETTEKYRDLFEALHKGQPQAIDWSTPAMQQLLPDHALPGQLREERAAGVAYQYHANLAPVVEKLDGLHTRLTSIEQSNQKMADKWDSHALPDGNVVLVDPATGSIHKIATG